MAHALDGYATCMPHSGDTGYPVGVQPDGIVLPASVESSRLARRRVERFADAERIERVDALSVIVSELVTNAVMHGNEPIVLHLARRGHVVRVEVTDCGTDANRVRFRAVDPARPGGRGLRIVAAFADEWGVERTNAGTVVWATCSVSTELEEGNPTVDSRPRRR